MLWTQKDGARGDFQHNRNVQLKCCSKDEDSLIRAEEFPPPSEAPGGRENPRPRP